MDRVATTREEGRGRQPTAAATSDDGGLLLVLVVFSFTLMGEWAGVAVNMSKSRQFVSEDRHKIARRACQAFLVN
jgi:hypothetical protein